jgi:DNA-binding NarL/FixJ family response regulator
MDHVLTKAGIRHLLETLEDLRPIDEERAIACADVVVIDLDAPDRTGEESRQPREPESRPPALVALTATTSAERISDGVRAGVAAFVAIQSPSDELVQAIRLAARGEMYFDPRITDIVVSRLRQRTKSIPPGERRSRYEELSERERTVLRLVAEGHTGPEIGRALGITAKTVDTYRHRIQDKIGLMHRRDYIHFALEIGVLRP